jgi:hypothetical protein
MANNDKNRKSEAQERFEEADNAGRFAGNDQDSRDAKNAALQAGAVDTTGYNSGTFSNSNRDGSEAGDERTDTEAHRDAAQSHNYKGEAQNVNDDTSRPMQENELTHARNKASESKGRESSE